MSARRERTKAIQLKDFRTQVIERVVERKNSTCADRSGKAGTLFGWGAYYGHTLRELDRRRKNYSATYPGAKVVNDFNARRTEVAEEIGSAALMCEADAVEFLSGILAELKWREPKRGNYADVIWRVFRDNTVAVLMCPTMRHVADLVKLQLPPEKVERWTKREHVEFYNSVRMFCQRIGFSPAKPGRPRK